MLHALAVENYRLLRSIVVPLGKLNVIQGANGSGKSNLYKTLRLLADTAAGGVVSSLAREGGLKSTFWAGPEKLSRDMRTGRVPVQGTQRKDAVRLKSRQRPKSARPATTEMGGVMRHRLSRAGMERILIVLSLVLISWGFTGCGVRNDESGTSAAGTNASKETASTPPKSGGTDEILLFGGTGSSPNDVKAFETILKDHHVNYTKVNSSQLNEMSESQMRGYRLLIVPGGNFIDIGNGLTPVATENIRNAVRNGLNYLGVCAGAFFAGNSPTNGLNLTSGVKFGFYAAEDRGIRKAAVPIAVAGGKTLEHYWEDGPQLAGWGAVVGKYPDGTPAIVQGTCGSGWVILSGVHPEAPASWRGGMTFTTPVSADTAYAWLLIQAALKRESLPHF